MPIKRLYRFTRRLIITIASSLTGALVVLLIGGILFLENRPDLEIWHLAELDEEFTADSNITNFNGYLALEDRLFSQLDEKVYAQVPARLASDINRYHRGSLADPDRWDVNWNRSFELDATAPKAGILLLHGMSDSPYSLRSVGERLHFAGAYVVGLRVPGHGTAPSGLVETDWRDMAAAVELAMKHLAEKAPGAPLFVVGYSNGAALGVLYTATAIANKSLPMPSGLVLISPAIGVTRAAAFAVWQARVGHLLGLDKLAWNSIQLEYDPFKYNSFAVNAGDTVYQITNQIQSALTSLDASGELGRFPPVLAFSSVVDATVSAPALVSGLFDRLLPGDHELVLFDINRTENVEFMLQGNPTATIESLLTRGNRQYALNVVVNESAQSRRTMSYAWYPGSAEAVQYPLNLTWPDDVYSLSHVALPFRADDPLYGGQSAPVSPGIQLGDMAMRGERGILGISANDRLRLRWNPFFDYLEHRTLAFLGLESDTDPVAENTQ